MWEVFKEVLIESMLFYFIWLGVPTLLYGIAFVVMNVSTIKARLGKKKRSHIEPLPKKKTITYPDGRVVEEGVLWIE